MRGEVLIFVLSLPLFLLSARLIREVDDPVWPDPMYLACALLHAVLLLRVRHTWIAFGLGSGACLLLMGAPDLLPAVTGLPGALPAVLLPSALLFPVLLGSAAAHARSNSWFALVVGVAGVLELVSRLWFGLPWVFEPTAGLVVWRIALGGAGLALVLLAWTLGRWRATVLGYRRLDGDRRCLAGERDTAHRDRAVAQQQARMSLEMQNAVAIALQDIVDRAQKGRGATRRAPALADDALADIYERGEEALGRVRSLVSLLENASPEELLVHETATPILAPEHDLSPQPQLADLPKLIDAARDQGLIVSLEIVGERGRVGVAGELATYRAVQEGLTNTVRHAGPSAVANVQLTWSPAELVVTVKDTREASHEVSQVQDDFETWGEELVGPFLEGRGLRVVRERLETLGGELEIELLEEGFCIRGIIPRLDRAEESDGAASLAQRQPREQDIIL